VLVLASVDWAAMLFDGLEMLGVDVAAIGAACVAALRVPVRTRR
jgi:hypothetical protein